MHAAFCDEAQPAAVLWERRERTVRRAGPAAESSPRGPRGRARGWEWGIRTWTGARGLGWALAPTTAPGVGRREAFTKAGVHTGRTGALPPPGFSHAAPSRGHFWTLWKDPPSLWPLFLSMCTPGLGRDCLSLVSFS